VLGACTGKPFKLTMSQHLASVFTVTDFGGGALLTLASCNHGFFSFLFSFFFFLFSFFTFSFQDLTAGTTGIEESHGKFRR